MKRINAVTTLPLLAALASLLGGCATTGQRVALDCNFAAKATERATTVASTLAEAAACTDMLVKSVRERLDAHERTVNAARAGTVLGTLGATVAGVYSAHRDTIVGLGLLGGSSFAYGSLYAPPPFLAIYAAGLDAAMCVSGVARQAAGDGKAIADSRRAVEAEMKALEKAELDYSRARASAKQAARAAKDDAASALRSATVLLAEEPHLANGLVNIAYEISGAIDQQIIANSPSLQAFRDASQAALGIAQSMVPADVPAPAPAGDGARVAELGVDEAHTAALIAATKKLADATIRLQARLKTFGAADATACLARARNPAIKAFALVPAPAGDEITLDKGATYAFTATGGQPSYRAFFAGTQPPAAELVLTQDASVFRLEAKDALKQEYLLVVQDAGPGAPKQLKVKPKPAAGK